MDRKVIRTYQEYLEQGNSSFHFDTWLDKMTEECEDEVSSYQAEEIKDTIENHSYVNAKRKLAQSRLFNGASKFSVNKVIKNSSIGYPNAREKAYALLRTDLVPFSLGFRCLNENNFESIIYNTPFPEDTLDSLQHMSLLFLLSDAVNKNDTTTRLYRTLVVLNAFIELSNFWRWERKMVFNFRNWKVSARAIVDKGAEELHKRIRATHARYNSVGLVNLKSVIAAYDLIPKVKANKIIMDYIENGVFPDSDTVEKMMNELDTDNDDSSIDRLMEVPLPSSDGLVGGNIITPHILPLPSVLMDSAKKKLMHIPNAKGQMKMSVKSINNMLYNPRLFDMMLEELQDLRVETHTFWTTQLGEEVIKSLYDGYREVLGKTAWKEIGQKHFSYEHIAIKDESVDIIFSLEKEDILTASSAGNSWSSCHGSSYGHSPIFMAGDEVTFIVYEKGSGQAEEGVDSKRWRAYGHLWYDSEDKEKMVFSIEHPYPNNRFDVREIVEGIVLDGLESKFTTNATIFDHGTINTIQGTTSYGYYDYHERMMRTHFTYDILDAAKHWDEEFYNRGIEVLDY